VKGEGTGGKRRNGRKREGREGDSAFVVGGIDAPPRQ